MLGTYKNSLICNAFNDCIQRITYYDFIKANNMCHFNSILAVHIIKRHKRYSTMNFQPSEITQQVAQTARDFAQQHIKPHVMEWDETPGISCSYF